MILQRIHVTYIKYQCASVEFTKFFIDIFLDKENDFPLIYNEMNFFA